MSNFNDLDNEEEVVTKKETDPKKKKLMMIVTVALIVLIGGIVGIFVASNREGNTNENYDVVEVTSLAEGDVSKSNPNQTETLVLFDLPEVNTQIGNAITGMGNLRLSLNIEFAQTADVKRIEALTPKILDTIISHTSALTYDEITGAQGLYFLREELLFRINTITDPVKIYNLNFKNIELIR
ncbi:MAG: flagellar basal body-associated FliL family protein [Alphaproteobacteria bacterium]|nr:flagellar basal body-associated FliL family protein [Alphaproteobacteria bacterium]